MSEEPRRAWWREELGFLLELGALTGFAIAQPVLGAFGKAPEQFAFRAATRRDIVAFALLVAVVPPLALWAATAVARLGGRGARRVAQALVEGALVGVVAVEVGKRLGSLQGAPLVVLAVAVGAGFGLARLRLDAVRMWTRYAGPAPALFVAAFLFVSPTSKLVLTSSPGTADLGPRARAAPVVFLQLDELPLESLVGSDGRIDATLFPNFARLAAGSTWYRNYTSLSNETFYAVPTLLSGSVPRDGQSPSVADHPHNLFTLLGGAYDVHAQELITRLCPAEVCGSAASTVPGGLGKLLGDADRVLRTVTSPRRSQQQLTASLVETTARSSQDFENERWSPLPSDQTGTTLPRFTRFLAGIGPSTRPTLDFVHLLVPHQPWFLYPSGTKYPFPNVDPGRAGPYADDWGTATDPVELGRQRHLLQTQYADHLVGQLLDRLHDTDVYDRSLVVVTADHGVAFEPGEGVRAHGRADPVKGWPDLAFTALFVKAPGQQQGVVDDDAVQSIDLLPTIADLLHLPIPWKLDGRSAAHGPPRVGDARTFCRAEVVPFQGGSLHPCVTKDGAAGAQAVRDRSLDSFRDRHGDPRWQLYRVGPEPALVGRRVADLDVGAASGRTASVTDRGAFAAVDPGSGTVPGLVRATVDGSAGAEVAVALDGTVGAVWHTFSSGSGPPQLAALLPDFLFRQGRNDLALYEVVATVSGPSLRPIALR